MWFFLAGGFPMLFITAFGLIALASACRFAWVPERGRVLHLVALCTGLVFASLAGVAADLVMVSIRVPADPEWAHSPDLPLILLAGFGESLSPAILGFSLIAVVAVIAAIGLRRMPAATTAP